MMTHKDAGYLLDANVAIALVVAEHEHHQRAVHWFAGATSVAFCPIVEGALLRFLFRIGEKPITAHLILNQLNQHPRVSFIPDSISYTNVNLDGVYGHRQLTDAYLAELASTKGRKLATFDAALHALRPTQTELLGGHKI